MTLHPSGLQILNLSSNLHSLKLKFHCETNSSNELLKNVKRVTPIFKKKFRLKLANHEAE